MTNESHKQSAADKASRLSQLFEEKGFLKDGPARWLRPEHVERFLRTLNSVEAKRLAGLLGFGSHSAGELETNSLRFLDSLWIIGVNYFGASRSTLVSDPPAGKQFVNRLAELQPELIGAWWKWRCATSRALTPRLSSAQKGVICALSQEEAENNLASLSDPLVAAIVGVKPALVDVIPRERWGSVAAFAVGQEASKDGIIESLSQRLIPSDVVAVIDAVLGSAETSDSSNALDELVTQWRGPENSDPITGAVMRGHERLKAQLRSPWSLHRKSSERRNNEVWQDPLKWRAGRAFAAASRVAPNDFGLELGFSVGVHLADEETEPSREGVVARFDYLRIEPDAATVDVVLPIATLWATLRTLAKYEADSWKHDTELAGLRTRIVSLAHAAPAVWAQSLEWILLRAPELGAVADAVTLDLAMACPDVERALEKASHHSLEMVRLKARGILSLLHGIEDPSEGLSRTLADAAARYMDGAPVFPYPLAAASTTWLGSLGVERAISNGLRRAAERFSGEVRDQGGDIEEALTKALVKEVEVAFREAQPRLNLSGPKQSRALNPVLSVHQRPTSKTLEEPEYGCDLAWLLTANVLGRYRLTWVDLVQVKKSKALYHQPRPNSSRVDSWSIENDQLDNILKWSASATYWLIGAAGEVLVIPAKHLLAIKSGTVRRESAKTFTIGYNDVRSAAIPLEQYLLDLLIGQWLGTSSPDAINFVEGNATIRPRIVIEVSLSVGRDNQ